MNKKDKNYSEELLKQISGWQKAYNDKFEEQAEMAIRFTELKRECDLYKELYLLCNEREHQSNLWWFRDFKRKNNLK